jgi:phosphoglycolate phosphatase-like HAD superfamily hydrolase
MIGHNNGPPLGDISDVGGVARLYYWRKAHKAAWRTPPIEIVKLRYRAAEQLGISYKDYTSILLDRGRRPSAIFFDLAGALVRTRNNVIDTDRNGAVTLMPGVRKKLQRLGDCSVFVIAKSVRARETVEGYVNQVSDCCSIKVTDHAIGDGATLDMVNDLLAKLRIPASQAVLVGDTVEAEKSAEAAKLARFFWAWHYFGENLMASA